MQSVLWRAPIPTGRTGYIVLCSAAPKYPINPEENILQLLPIRQNDEATR